MPRPFASRPDLIGDNPAANVYRVLREIALAEAETGDVKAALATVAGHGNNVWRSPLLADIARFRPARATPPGRSPPPRQSLTPRSGARRTA